MKKYILGITLLASSLQLLAQDVKENNTLINKLNQPCITADYTVPGDIVEGALIKKLADMKISKSSKASDGFKLHKGVTIPEITKETIDLYYKIDDKKVSSTVTFAISKGYDNFVKKESDSITIENAKVYLTNFMNDITKFSLNKQIIEQGNSIKDLEKKLKNQAKDEEGYTKDKSKIESKIQSNKIDIDGFKLEMEAQQKALELVREKKATIEGMDALKKEVSKQESATEKATKKYNKALESATDLNENLKKAEDKITNAAQEQIKTKAEIATINSKIDELKTQLAAVK